MWRSIVTANFFRQFTHCQPVRAQIVLYNHSSALRDDTFVQRTINPTAPSENRCTSMRQVGNNISGRDKSSFLIETLTGLDNSKESVYRALDAWVAFETDFPVGPIKKALIRLEKDCQWQRVIHVIKWMLSKGQGTTRGTYGQLIRALDMDHRAEEAHEIWVKKLGCDLHSVPWQLCHQMISIYYRNNMLDRVVELFKGLEAFNRKPPDKMIVQKVANAYELLGLFEDRERVLEKYQRLFAEPSSTKKLKIAPHKCFVCGLSWLTTDQSLEEAFFPYGEIRLSQIVRDVETGRSRGFGFVVFKTRHATRDVVKGMNGQNLDGRIITIKEAWRY